MQDRYKATWSDHQSNTWELIGSDWYAGIMAGGIEGLMGEVTDTVMTSPMVPGQVVDHQQINPMTGTLRLGVRTHNGVSAEETWAKFRQGFHHRFPGTLILETPGGPLTARLRRNGVIPAPEEDPSSAGNSLRVEVPVISDDGCWWTEWEQGSEIVTVTNDGDIPIGVEIRWQGSGGVVTMPSGAEFTLPGVPGPRVLNLSPSGAIAVTHVNGVLDREFWKILQRVAYPEGVAIGDTQQFRLPLGATLRWRKGVLDPWQ